MITDTIQNQIASALKAKDQVRLSTLRMLSSALNYKRIELQHDLTEEEELGVVRAEVKKRRDAIEAYQKASRQELADKEQQELEILKAFLPPEISDQELEEIISQAITETNASSLADMGKVMGIVMARSKGQADGSKVSQLVKSKLSS